MKNGKSFEEASGAYFDKELAQSLYPKGRTARTLCCKCNAFLGKYDEAYLKFFNADGNPKVIKGFQRETRVAIIKAIFGNFLSVPEAAKMNNLILLILSWISPKILIMVIGIYTLFTEISRQIYLAWQI